MARAKKIIRKSEREALKERRRSGEFKQDKKDARAAGLSRGDARKRAKRLSRVQALANRKSMRADMDAKRNEDASVNKMFGDRRRMEAKRGGQKLAYEGKSKPIYSMADVAPGGVPTKKIKSGDKVSKERGMYKIVGADGYVRYSESKPEIIKTRKNKAMYGAKVKPVKKAKHGGKITDPLTKSLTIDGKGEEYKTLEGKRLAESINSKDSEMRGSFGPKRAESSKMIAKSDNIKSNKVTVKGKEKGYVPDNAFDRRKSVEKFNEGYKKNIKKTVKAVKKAKNGGRLKRLKKKADKKIAKGYDIRAKVESSQRGETPAMSEKKMDRLRKRADKKNRKGFAALKKIKDGNEASKGGKVVKRGGKQRPAKPFRTMEEIKERRDRATIDNILEEKKTRRLINK